MSFEESTTAKFPVMTGGVEAGVADEEPDVEGVGVAAGVEAGLSEGEAEMPGEAVVDAPAWARREARRRVARVMDFISTGTMLGCGGWMSRGRKEDVPLTTD